MLRLRERWNCGSTPVCCGRPVGDARTFGAPSSRSASGSSPVCSSSGSPTSSPAAANPAPLLLGGDRTAQGCYLGLVRGSAKEGTVQQRGGQPAGRAEASRPVGRVLAVTAVVAV